MIRNKKGSLDDIGYIIYILIAFSIIALVMFKFTSSFSSEYSKLDVPTNQTKDLVSQINQVYPTAVDSGFLLLTFGLCLVALVLAFLVVIHPVFFIFYLIMLPFIIIIGGVASNIYDQAATSTALGDVAAQMVFMSHIMRWLPIIVGTFGFILAVVMYKTWRENR